MLLALYGRELSGFEKAVRDYFLAADKREDIVNPKNAELVAFSKQSGSDFYDLRKAEMNYRHSKETLVTLFLLAVERRDGEALVNLGHAFGFLQKRESERVPVDKERYLLLLLKDITGGEPTMTIRQVARFILRYPHGVCEKLESKDDGFSALRRKCKEIGLPLKESRNRSRK